MHALAAVHWAPAMAGTEKALLVPLAVQTLQHDKSGMTALVVTSTVHNPLCRGACCSIQDIPKQARCTEYHPCKLHTVESLQLQLTMELVRTENQIALGHPRLRYQWVKAELRFQEHGMLPDVHVHLTILLQLQAVADNLTGYICAISLATLMLPLLHAPNSDTNPIVSFSLGVRWVCQMHGRIPQQLILSTGGNRSGPNNIGAM